MTRIIKIRKLGYNGYYDAAIVTIEEDNGDIIGDIIIDGEDKSTRTKVLELLESGIDIDGVQYALDTFADGLILFFNSPPYFQAFEVDVYKGM